MSPDPPEYREIETTVSPAQSIEVLYRPPCGGTLVHEWLWQFADSAQQVRLANQLLHSLSTANLSAYQLHRFFRNLGLRIPSVKRHHALTLNIEIGAAGRPAQTSFRVGSPIEQQSCHTYQQSPLQGNSDGRPMVPAKAAYLGRPESGAS